MGSFDGRAKTDQFARQIYGPEALREPFQSIYSNACGSGECKHAVFAPQLTNLPMHHEQPATDNLLMVFTNHLLIATKREDQSVETLDVPFTDLLCVEIGEALLFCWMKLIFSQDTCREIEMPFNLVGMSLFTTALSLIRDSLEATRSNSPDLAPVKPDLPFKFNNLLGEWLNDDESVCAYAFQPEVRARRFLVLERQVVPPLLATLTNRQFLFIAEEEPLARERLGEYSEIYTYFPLSRLGSLTVVDSPKENGLSDVQLTLIKDSVQLKIKKTISSDLLSSWSDLSSSVNALLRQRSDGQATVSNPI